MSHCCWARKSSMNSIVGYSRGCLAAGHCPKGDTTFEHGVVHRHVTFYHGVPSEAGLDPGARGGALLPGQQWVADVSMNGLSQRGRIGGGHEGAGNSVENELRVAANSGGHH